MNLRKDHSRFVLSVNNDCSLQHKRNEKILFIDSLVMDLLVLTTIKTAAKCGTKLKMRDVGNVKLLNVMNARLVERDIASVIWD